MNRRCNSCMLSLEESINNLRRAKSESLSVEIDLLLPLLRDELLREERDLLRDTNRTSRRASSGRAWGLVSRRTGRPSNEVQGSAPSDEVGRLGPGLLSPWGDLLLRVERDLLLLDEGDLLLPLLRDQLLRDVRDLLRDDWLKLPNRFSSRRAGRPSNEVRNFARLDEVRRLGPGDASSASTLNSSRSSSASSISPRSIRSSNSSTDISGHLQPPVRLSHYAGGATMRRPPCGACSPSSRLCEPLTDAASRALLLTVPSILLHHVTLRVPFTHHRRLKPVVVVGTFLCSRQERPRPRKSRACRRLSLP